MDINKSSGEMLLDRWFRHEAWRKDPEGFYKRITDNDKHE